MESLKSPSQLSSRDQRLAAQRRVLEKEFDLELHLKRCELASISEEINKGEKLLEALRIAILNPQLTGLAMRPPQTPIEMGLVGVPETTPRLDPRLPSIAVPSGLKIAERKAEELVESTSPTLRRRATRKPVPDGALYAQRFDGQLVRMDCPSCSRSDFSNIQGFVNHTRISHGTTYLSHEHAVRECGIEVSSIPEDSERGLKVRPHPPLDTSGGRPGNDPLTRVDNEYLVDFAEDEDMDGQAEEDTDDDGTFRPEV